MNRSNEKYKRIVKYIMFFSFLLFVLQSCKNADTYLSAKELRTLSLDDIYDTVQSKSVDFNTLTAKFNVSTSLSKINAKGTLKIKEDSIIWASVTAMLGIEAARISITKDSIKILNRLKKEYIIYDFKKLSDILGVSVNYTMVESFLLGEFKLKDTTTATLNNYKIQNNKKTSEFTFTKKKVNENDFEHIISVDNTNLKIKEIEIKDNVKKRDLNLKYSNFTEVDSCLFPKQVFAVAKQETDSLYFKAKYLNINIDKDQNYKFSVPGNYKTIKYNK